MGSIYVASANPLPVFLGKCERCPRPVRVRDSSAIGDHNMFSCLDCGTPVKCERVYGTVNRMECDARCMGAMGPSCSCGCGGENHGGRWSEPGTMLASELAVYREGIARKEAERVAKVTRERRRLSDVFAAWVAEGHSQLVTDLLAVDWWEGRYPNEFLADMAELVRDKKPLTDRQAEAAERTIGKRRLAAERAEERAANATEVPTGRIKFTGTIVGMYAVPDNYSYNGGDIRKMVIDTGTYRVRGSVPSSLFRDEQGYTRVMYDEDFKGRRVTLTATLSPDGKEVGSGYFKRPTGAVFVTD